MRLGIRGPKFFQNELHYRAVSVGPVALSLHYRSILNFQLHYRAVSVGSSCIIVALSVDFQISVALSCSIGKVQLRYRCIIGRFSNFSCIIGKFLKYLGVVYARNRFRMIMGIVYTQTKFPKDLSNNILKFWYQYENIHPNIAILAKKYISQSQPPSLNQKFF